MFPLLQSRRFILNEINPDDEDFVFTGLSHPDVIAFYGVQFTSFEATTVQMDFYRSLVETDTGLWWKIVEKETTERVGAIGYNNYQKQHNKAEIGYWLLPQFWKKGIISEVLPLVVHYMQSKKGIHRIEALVEEGNKASCGLLERAGFLQEGFMKDCEIKNGKYISLLMYSLIAVH